MNRIELTAVLKKLSPALATRDLIQIFSAFCFSEGSVHAYDDIVAISIPFDSPIRGGVRGSLLLNWLSASRAKEVEIVQKGEQITLKAAKAKLDTPVLPESDFLFQPPNVSKAREQKLDADFLSALAKASISLGRDPASPWRLGVTVVFTDTGTLFYASNDLTAAKVRLGKPSEEGTTSILPPRFVELLQDIGKSDPPVKMLLTKSWAEARFSSGLRLFSKTISGADLATFSQTFQGLPKELVPVPKGLDRALERALTVVGFCKDPFTKLKISEGRIKLLTESPIGNVSDMVTLGEQHADASVGIRPESLLKGLPYAESLCVLPDKVYLRGPGFIYLSASVHGDQEETSDKD